MGTRQSVIKDAVPVELWPQVLDIEFDDRQRAQFRAQAEAMRLYFSWVPVAEIEKRTGVNQTLLPKLAKRCLEPAADGRIQGFRACIPFARTNPYRRVSELPHSPPSERGGLAGALGALLERFPNIEEDLLRYIKHDSKHLAIPENKLRPIDLHRIFLRCLEDKGVTKNEWPFTTKYRGLRSIQEFMKTALERNFSHAVQTRGSGAARAHLAVGKGINSLLDFDEPYEAVEIDTYKFEAHVTVAFQTPEGLETDVRLDRLNLIAVVDRFSTAVLAYTVVYRTEINADDVLRVIRQAASGTWVPMELTIPGLRYPDGGGLPSGVVNGAQGALWSATMFDGALAHLSSAVHARARAALGFALNWGPVAHFERRPNVEKTFWKIGNSLFKRLPSTTGANPQNGRADEAERKAVELRIRAADIEQLLDVTFAQHNTTPTEGISFLTPLEAIRYFIDRPERFECRMRPGNRAVEAGFSQYEPAIVRGSQRDGRRPYIQIDRVHYTNEVLASAAHLIGHRVLVEIDEEDMRQVKVYLANGAELGVLKAHGKWSVTKHSRRTRKTINSLLTKRLVTVSAFDDPVQVFLKHLATQNKGGKAKAPKPKQVSEIVRVKKESGQDPTVIYAPPPPPRSSEVVRRVLNESPGRILTEPTPDFFSKVKNRR